MPSKAKRQKRRESEKKAGRQLSAGLLMALLASLCFTTAIAFDTNIHGTFDLSKLAFVYLAAMAAVLGALLRLLVTGELRLPRTPLDWPIAACVIAAALATTFSVDWRCSLFGAYKTYEGLFQIIAYAILFLAATRLRRREVIVVVGVIITAAFGAGMYGIMQRLGHDPLGWSKSIAGREISTFGNPVFFGMYTAMFIPAAAGLALRAQRRGDGERHAAWWWASGAAVSGLFCSWFFPSLHIYRGEDSLGSMPKAAALIAASLLVCALLGHRLLLRRLPTGWSRGQSWWAAFMAIALSGALYTSRTVGALLAVVCALLWFTAHMALADRESFRRQRRLWLVLGASLLTIHLVLNLRPGTSTTGRISKLVFRTNPDSSASARDDTPARELAPSGSLYKRLLLYRSGINIFRSHPVLGVGPDAIERVIAPNWSADWQLEHGHLVEVEGFENRLHNEAIELLASQGIVGFAARAWLYAAFLVMLWRAAKVEETGEQAVLAGLGASWALMVICNVFEYPTIPISAAFWVLMGLTVAWTQNRGDESVWASRTVHFGRRPNALLGSAILVVALALAAFFWVVALQRPYRADRHFMAGQALLRANKLERAREELSDAVRLAPYLHVYREQLCTTLNKMAAGFAEQTGEAQSLRGESLARDLVTTARSCVRRSPWRAVGYAYLGMGEETLADVLDDAATPTPGDEVAELRRQSTVHLKQAVEVNPHNAGVRALYARHCIQNHQWQEFQRIAEDTLARWPEERRMSELVIHAATTLINAKDTATAEKLLLLTKNRIAASLQGKVWEGLGRIYWAEKRWQDLESAGRTLVTVDPDSRFGPRMLAIALAQQGELDEAEDAARELVESHPDDEYGKWLLTNIVKMDSEGKSTTDPGKRP